MKRLQQPTCSDNDIAYSLAKKDRNPRRAHLQYFLPQLLSQYKEYISNRGDPWRITGTIAQPCLKKALLSFYDSTLDELKVINEIRVHGSPDVCPMCGSEKTGTVDHYLPQANYPEFAVFTKNLVPACDCNSKRQNTVLGVQPEQRVLHPYFDVCMERRLVSAHFVGSLDKPTIQLVVCCGPILDRSAVEFHVDEVLKKTMILNWFDKKWSTLINRPKSLLAKLPDALVAEQDVRDAISHALQAKDEELATPNSWMSIFYHGLLTSPNVSTWLVDRINNLRNGTVVLE